MICIYIVHHKCHLTGIKLCFLKFGVIKSLVPWLLVGPSYHCCHKCIPLFHRTPHRLCDNVAKPCNPKVIFVTKVISSPRHAMDIMMIPLWPFRQKSPKALVFTFYRFVSWFTYLSNPIISCIKCKVIYYCGCSSQCSCSSHVGMGLLFPRHRG